MNNFRLGVTWAAAAFLLSAASIVQAQDSQIPVPETDERLVQQGQRIEQLEERIQQLEAEAMSGAVLESHQVTGSPSPDVAGTPPGQLEAISGDVRDTHQLLTRDELTSDEFPASWPIFGTNTRMKIGPLLPWMTHASDHLRSRWLEDGP